MSPKRLPAPRAPEPPRLEEIPPRMVAIAYVLAVVCVVAPLAVLGAGFAGAVLIRRGRPGQGAGVIAVAVVGVVAAYLLRSR